MSLILWVRGNTFPIKLFRLRICVFDTQGDRVYIFLYDSKICPHKWKNAPENQVQGATWM